MPVIINGTTGISGVDGSAGTPAFQGSDTNTGIRFGTDIVSLVTGGSDRLYIDSSGRVGIGTTSAAGQLSCTSDFVFGNQSSTGTGGTGRIVATGGEVYIQGGLAATSGSAAPIVFSSYGGVGERARIDTSGRLLVGTSSSPTGGQGVNSRLVVQGYVGDANDIGIISIQRGETAGNITSGEYLGRIAFNDSTGNSYAYVEALADGNAGSGDFPGRLSFSTTADGASSPTERMRITSAGYLKVTSDGTYNDSTGLQHELTQSTSGTDVLILRSKNASLAAGTLEVSVSRANNSAYNFFRGWSSGFSDLEFNLRGDGNAFADGTWTGGGADYAEYFEWADSNPNEEDRRGISVVLDGDKIREAVAGDEPIGVISGNPSMVGDAAWNKWSGKYLRDDFGTYIQEDYEVINDDGETVVQQRRKLNPAYDPDAEYIPREQRPEWDCVGLMGKLRIRKGQVTGSRWIKMREISATVEEWLVR